MMHLTGRGLQLAEHGVRGVLFKKGQEIEQMHGWGQLIALKTMATQCVCGLELFVGFEPLNRDGQGHIIAECHYMLHDGMGIV